MADDNKIDLTIGLNASGLSADIQRVSNQVGKATTGVARGISAAMGSSLGPVGELIEKLDAAKLAMDGVTGASKLLAGAVALIGVAAVYGVTQAIEAFKEMRVAQDEANESAKRLKETQEKLPQTIKSQGIAKGQEGRSLHELDEQIATTQKEIKDRSRGSSRGNAAADAARYAEIKKLNEKLAGQQAARADVLSGEATRRGESRLGAATLDKGTASAIEAEKIRGLANGGQQEDLDRANATRRALVSVRQDADLGTQSGAAMANAANESITQLDKLIAALEENVKGQDEVVKALQEEGEKTAKAEEARANDQLTWFNEIDKKGGNIMAGVPSGYGVGGYTSTGGGGNIYGNVSGNNPVNRIASDVHSIAAAVTKPNQLILNP